MAKDTNGLDQDLAISFVERIESLNRDLESERGTYMARCRPIQDAKKQVYDEGKDAGIRKAAMKVLVEKRKKLREIVKAESELEDDDRENYGLLDDAIPGLDDLPLGIAALDNDRKAGRTRRRKPEGNDAQPAV
jgi:hypothetical protein